MTYVIVEAYKMALVRLLVDLVDRLERRYLNSDGHAQPRPPARHEGLAEPGRGPNPVVAQVEVNGAPEMMTSAVTDLWWSYGHH